jgi:hypothetical protein
MNAESEFGICSTQMRIDGMSTREKAEPVKCEDYNRRGGEINRLLLMVQYQDKHRSYGNIQLSFLSSPTIIYSLITTASLTCNLSTAHLTRNRAALSMPTTSDSFNPVPFESNVCTSFFALALVSFPIS